MAYKTLTDYYIDIVKESKEIKEEPLEEATDLFDADGIKVTRFSMGKGKIGIQLTLDKKTGIKPPHDYINFDGNYLGRVIKALQVAQKRVQGR